MFVPHLSFLSSIVLITMFGIFSALQICVGVIWCLTPHIIKLHASPGFFGSKNDVDLVSMVDRRFNRELPIESNFIGVIVDALDDAYVSVEWSETQGQDRILIFENK